MNTIRLTYKRKAVCPCGYGVLKDDIPLGKQYDLAMDTVCLGTLICGRCLRLMRVTLIREAATSDDSLYGGWLVLEIFEEK